MNKFLKNFLDDYDLLTLNRNLTANDLKVYTGTVYDPNDYKNGIQTTINKCLLFILFKKSCVLTDKTIN